MSISFNQKTQQFRLTTQNTLYVFELAYGKLIHLYYGKKFGAVIPDFRADYPKAIAFAPYREFEYREFGMTTLPQEYSYFGSGDFRATALRIKNGDGNAVTEFDYVSHKIRKGRVEIPRLPHARADERTQTLEITLKDPVSNCELHLYYTVFYDCDVISRYASVTNHSGGDVVIEKWMSLALDLKGNQYDVISLGGAHNQDRAAYERTPAFRGNLSFGSRRGASSHQMNPFMAVCARNADENRGDVYGFNLVYSGSFLNEVEGDLTNCLRIQTGLGGENFNYRLKDGETVFCPEAVMTYSAKGFGPMSRSFHRFVNNHIVPEKAKETRPIVLNSWEALYFDIDEDTLVDFSAAAAKCGMDMVIMDDGWFGARINDKAGLGDWFVNRDRFKDGLAPFIDRVKATGVKFGIWIEPEMVNPDSDLYRAHPDWCIQCPNRPLSQSRNQYVLDMANPAVIDYLKKTFEETFRGASIDYFKWDMNRHISEPGSPYLAAADQGSMEFRYMQNVYDLFHWFEETYPDAMIENCSGGGGRYDLAMMSVSSQIWTSDNTNARMRTLIQYSSMLAYPASVMSCHVSDPKGDLHELDLKYKVAVNGILGYEFNVLNTPDAIKDAIRKQVAEYRTYRHLIKDGAYYRLASPYETPISAYYFQKGDELLVTAILTDGKAILGKPKKCEKLVIRTADPKATYRDARSGLTVSGETLKKGLPIGEFEPDATGYDAKLWHFIKE